MNGHHRVFSLSLILCLIFTHQLMVENAKLFKYHLKQNKVSKIKPMKNTAGRSLLKGKLNQFLDHRQFCIPLAS